MNMSTSDGAVYKPTLKIILYLRSSGCSVVRCAGGSMAIEFRYVFFRVRIRKPRPYPEDCRPYTEAGGPYPDDCRPYPEDCGLYTEAGGPYSEDCGRISKPMDRIRRIADVFGSRQTVFGGCEHRIWRIGGRIWKPEIRNSGNS
jgi:hypothetical protein